MTVLATAGHVDHGKSTLVNFLTGQETDRLDEEKKRGLTINLGFTYFEYQNEFVSIVDVPGHKDYFKNTVAGFSNVDAVLFCIDAVQGWSQQSEEHFQALINLDIKNIFFVFTKIDKMENRNHIDKLKTKISNYTTFNFEILEYSSIKSDRNEVQIKIINYLKNIIKPSYPPCLWVDRTFNIDGVGKVVTGTASKIFNLENIFVDCDQKKLDIREVQNVSNKIKSISSSSRLAISFKKNNESLPERGSLLTNQLNQRYRYVFIEENDASDEITTKGTIRIYIGTGNCIVKNIQYLNIEQKKVLLIEFNNYQVLIPNQTILLHNLSTNEFYGGKIIEASNNYFHIKKLINDSKNENFLSIDDLHIFYEKENPLNIKHFVEIHNKLIPKKKFENISIDILNNLEKVNSIGVYEYLFKVHFVETEFVEDLCKAIADIKLSNNQIFLDKNSKVNETLYLKINSLLSQDLNVNKVDLSNFNKEDIKTLFMNEYLYRIDSNLLISREHKNKLLQVIEELPNQFSVSDFKNLTNLSRKYSIPYLEFLDKLNITSKIDSDGTRKKLKK